MHAFTVAVFSYNHHQHFLPYLLRSVLQHVKDLHDLVVVWDDYVRECPIDFDLIRREINHPFRVILHSEIFPWPDAIGRWGWIKQQLCKMLCHSWCDDEYVWIVDGDVLITGDPVLFDPNGRAYLRYDASRPTHKSYLDFIRRYLGLPQSYPYDFVGSTALFNTYECISIDQHARLTSGMDLVKCVLDCIEQPNHDPWPFSEFETYGTWIYNTARHSHVLAERNWNYCAIEYNWNMPIQVMWDRGPPIRGSSLNEIYQWYQALEI